MSTDWMADGLCQTPAYTPYFADRRPHGMSRSQQTKAAKDVCARCPVVTTCLPWALAQEDGPAYRRHGVLGGLTAKERAELAGATDAAGEGIDDEDGAA
jgi:WhiB family redox-sensing transcriptional regulator